MVAQIQEPKRWIVCYHTTFQQELSLPMQISVCEADQSNPAGQSALFLMLYEICSTCKLFQGLIQTLLCVCVCIFTRYFNHAIISSSFTPHAKNHTSHQNLRPTQFPNPTVLPRCFALPTRARKK